MGAGRDGGTIRRAKQGAELPDRCKRTGAAVMGNLAMGSLRGVPAGCPRDRPWRCHHGAARLGPYRGAEPFHVGPAGGEQS